MKQKITLIAASVIILILSGIALFLRYGKPLIPVSTVEIIYSEGEDYGSNAAAYERLFRKSPVFIHFPGARTAPEWWAIDFNTMTIYSLNPPRRFLTIPYVLRNEPLGTMISNLPDAREWNWKFTETGVSFSGNAFSCKIIKK